MRLVAAALLLLLGAPLPACVAKKAPPVPPAVPPPPDLELLVGYRLVNKPADSSAKPRIDAEWVTPLYARKENALPIYPQAALKSGCGAGLVPVRLIVSDEGRVSSVEPIPDRPMAADACHDLFRAAVEEAVRRWNFSPAIRMTPVPGVDSTRFEQTAVFAFLDFEFLFEVVDGAGRVRSP